MPDHASLYPIPFTAVPVNAKRARDPVSIASLALPPLNTPLLMLNQEPAYVTADELCSTRVKVPSGGGGGGGGGLSLPDEYSKASTQTQLPPDEALRAPAGSMLMLCVPEVSAGVRSEEHTSELQSRL